MFNYHSLIPWGSFRGRQEEKWGSFRGWDHFLVDLGIISGSGSFRGRDHFGGCTVLVLRELLRTTCGSLLFYPVSDYSHTLHHHLFKARVTKDSRRALGQRWTTTPAKATKC